MGKIKKNPITTPLPKEALNPHLRMALDNARPLTMNDPKAEYQLVRDLLKAQTAHNHRRSIPTQTNKTRYGGPLSQTHIQSFYSRIGTLNPSKIPITILEKMRDDPQIALGLGMMKGILRGLDWSINCGDEEQKRFLEWSVKRIYPQLMRSLLTALEFGFSSNEIIWEAKDHTIADIEDSGSNNEPVRKVFLKRQMMVIKHIKDHHPATIRAILHPKTEEFLGISQTQNDGKIVVLKKGQKLLFFGFDQEFGNVFGRSRLQSAYKAWYWSEIFTNFMARYLERRGTPPLVVQHPMGDITVEGEVQDAGDYALELGMAMLENAVVALPFTPDANGNNMWGLDYLTDDKRSEMFEKILNYFDVLKLRGLCIPDRAVAQDLAPGGTSAGSESSRDLLLATLTSMIQELQQAINEGIIEVLQEANFPAEKIVSAEFVFGKPNFDQRQHAKEVIIEEMRQIPNYLRAGLVPRHVYNIKEMAKLVGVPLDDIKNAVMNLDELIPPKEEEQPDFAKDGDDKESKEKDKKQDDSKDSKEKEDNDE